MGNCSVRKSDKWWENPQARQGGRNMGIQDAKAKVKKDATLKASHGGIDLNDPGQFGACGFFGIAMAMTDPQNEAKIHGMDAETKLGLFGTTDTKRVVGDAKKAMASLESLGSGDIGTGIGGSKPKRR